MLFYANAAFGAHLSTVYRYLHSFLTFNAAILHPKKNLLRIFPRTGMLSARYFLLSVERIVSTPFRNADIFLNSPLLRNRCCSALRLPFSETVFRLVRLFIFGLHCSLSGHLSHWVLSNEATHCPFALLYEHFGEDNRQPGNHVCSVSVKLKISIDIRRFFTCEIGSD